MGYVIQIQRCKINRQLLSILLAIAFTGTGCLKTGDSAPLLQPQGKFAGRFLKIHLNLLTKKQDTTSYNVEMELVNLTFKFTGDTSRHAGSKGKFNYNEAYIQWEDSTVPAGTNSVNLPKPHLNGTYIYHYNGAELDFTAQNDTLKYYYDLKKSN